MRDILIGSRLINDESPAYVIAEIGNNHGGDVTVAAQMFKVAKDCGADAVKLQMRDNRNLYHRFMYDAPYVNRNSYGETYGKHREALELSTYDYEALKQVAEDIGIDFFATAFDIKSADTLGNILNMPAIKIASGGLTNTALISYAADTGKPLIISTGGGSFEDIDRVVDLMIEMEVTQYALLHCLASYPNQPSEINLNVITTMRRRYRDIPIDFSCHYNGICMAEGAFMLGARIIEKHFTLNHTWKGTDRALSLEPQGLKSLCQNLSRMYDALGDGNKVRHSSEDAPIRKMAQSVYCAKVIAIGDIIKTSQLKLQTPADGLPAWEIENIVGSKAIRIVEPDTLIGRQDYE